MAISINQDDVIQQVTSDILKEMSESNVAFTNEEIKNKINERIDTIFNNYKNEQFSIIADEIEEQDKFIQEQFFNFDDEDKDCVCSSENFIENCNCNVCEQSDSQENDVLPTEKKKFFQEFPELYKSELAKSMSSFKNALSSLKLLKESSIIEKTLIFTFLAVPAILGGFITLAFILLLIILWQLSIITKVFLIFFNKIEETLKSCIAILKNKIKIAKTSGGFFNKLLFSNALYSVIFLNGLMYLLVKGMMLPLRSISEADKIIANLLARSINIVTAGLKGPSELALNNAGIDGLKAGRTAKDRQAPKTKLQLKEKPKEKSKELNKVKRDLNKEQIKTQGSLKVAKALANKDSIKKGIEEGIKTADNVKLQNSEFGISGANISVKAANLNSPASAQLSSDNMKFGNRNGLSDLIMQNVLDKVKNAVTNIIDQNLDKPHANNKQYNPDAAKIQLALDENIKQSMEDLEKSQSVIKGRGGNLSKINDVYTNIGDSVDAASRVQQALSAGFPDGVWDKMSEDKKLEVALEFGRARDSIEDRDETHELEVWRDTHADASIKDFYKEMLDNAREDLEKEGQQFSERYGQEPDKLIKNEMIRRGIDPNTVLVDDDFKNIALSIVNKFPEEQRLGMMKDLGEHNAAFLEKEQCKEKLINNEMEHSFTSNLSSRDRTQNIGGQGICM